MHANIQICVRICCCCMLHVLGLRRFDATTKRCLTDGGIGGIGDAYAP